MCLRYRPYAICHIIKDRIWHHTDTLWLKIGTVVHLWWRSLHSPRPPAYTYIMFYKSTPVVYGVVCRSMVRETYGCRHTAQPDHTLFLHNCLLPVYIWSIYLFSFSYKPYICITLFAKLDNTEHFASVARNLPTFYILSAHLLHTICPHSCCRDTLTHPRFAHVIFAQALYLWKERFYTMLVSERTRVNLMQACSICEYNTEWTTSFILQRVLFCQVARGWSRNQPYWSSKQFSVNHC